MKYAKNVIDLVGNTPLVELQKASSQGALVLGKCEFMNPTHSIKDRIGSAMINDALEKGLINSDTIIIEPTSGNTGIALAAVCAAQGLKLILTMPSSMSIERQKLLKALGAEIVLTEPIKGMKGAVEKAVELMNENKNAIILQQFANGANPQIHRLTTAKEIWEDTKGRVDVFVAAIGTGGTITGVGEKLKEYNPSIKVIAVEPENSPVLSGGAPGAHMIQGIGAGFIPDVLNVNIYDEVIKVSNEDAYATSRELAKNEGLLVGISAGANVYATAQVASREKNRGKVIVTILCDTGERYLSTTLYDEER